MIALLSLLFCAVSAGNLAGCTTNPVNPDGCEDIELARCQAAPACSAFGADFDVEACERFYRDQCLKGLQTETDPGDPKIDACVRAIDRAGACARNGVTPCDLGTSMVQDPCSVIESPEAHEPCGFLDDYYEEDAGLSPFPEAGTDALPEAGPEAGTDAGIEAALDEAG